MGNPTNIQLRQAAADVLSFIYERESQLRSTPEQLVRHFAASGLMRCCALLRGIAVLQDAGMDAIGAILNRQHWETWLVSLYVLLAGDDGLQRIANDDVHWKRVISKQLKL